MPYIGRGGSGSFGIRERYEYTATSGQTAFTSTDINGKVLTFDNGSLIDVMLNGVMLKITTDWSAASGTVTLTSGASTSDEVTIIVYDVFALSDAMPKTGGTFTGGITVSSTDDDANADPTLTLYRNSASPADADFGGEITFKGKNDASQDVEYARIVSKMTDVSDGTEDGNVQFQVISNGSRSSRILLKGNGSTAFKNADVSIDDSKSLTIADGDLVIGTSGHGIDFSAVSHASGMTSELLDSYEEGTFSPSADSFSGTMTFTTARYTKIGKLVHVNFKMTSDGNGDTDQISISGFPFSAVAEHPVSMSHDMAGNGALQSNTTPTIPNGMINTAEILYVYLPTGGAFQYAFMGSGFIRVSGTYITA
jgi:hypothetical protein